MSRYLPIREAQLATLVDAAPEGNEWLHEQKFDGYRILAVRDERGVHLLTRRFNDWTAHFPSVATAIAKLPLKHVVLDGEVAMTLADGRTSFQALQNARGADDRNLHYFGFDMLAIDGEDLVTLPLEARKTRLAKLLGTRHGTLRYSEHVIGDGGTFFKLACRSGLEGIVSKRRDAPYVSGRSAGWLKTKCLSRQELVIGGFTDPEGVRTGIGSLLLGTYEHGKLVYAGKVGTGFSMKILAELHTELAALERADSPFDPEPPRASTDRACPGPAALPNGSAV